MATIHLSKEAMKHYKKQNNVDIGWFLTSIHVFHEVISEEYGMTGHPYIILHSDGSGRVVVPVPKAPRFEKEIFNFTNLKDLVKKSKSLIKKYKIEFQNY